MTELLPWQHKEFDQFCKQAALERHGHAWLLSGAEGIGKLSLVSHLARTLFCRQRQGNVPCGTCTDCHLFAAGTHPDWRLLQPEKKLITIDQIREAIDYASNMPQRTTFKILCLEPAEAMNLNAANALLKLLEEPPPGTVLFLVSHQPGLLLATLRSRCQHLKLPLPPTAAGVAWLQAQGYSGDSAALLQKAQGAPLRALAMTETGLLAEHELLLELVQELLAGQATPVQAARRCEKFSLRGSLDFLMHTLSQLLRSFQGDIALQDADLKELRERLQSVGEDPRGVMALHVLYENMKTAGRAASSPNNPNPLLILETMFADWCKLRPFLTPARGRP